MNTTETPKEGNVLLSSGPPLWRVQLVRLLQLLGIGAAFVGGAEFMQIVALLPPETAAWLLTAGPALAVAAKPTIEFIGDWADNGKADGSFRLPIVFLLATLSLVLTGCGTGGLNLGLDAEGCVTTTFRFEDGRPYKVKACPGPDGKIATYRTEWTSEDGRKLKAVYDLKTKSYAIFYEEGGGWLQYSSKAGFLIGALPPTLDS